MHSDGRTQASRGGSDGLGDSKLGGDMAKQCPERESRWGWI